MLILIESEYVQSEMRRGVTFGNALPAFDIFSHIKSEKGPKHFVSKVKVKKSDKVDIGQHLVESESDDGHLNHSDKVDMGQDTARFGQGAVNNVYRRQVCFTPRSTRRRRVTRRRRRVMNNERQPRRLPCVTDPLPSTSTSNPRHQDADRRSEGPTPPPPPPSAPIGTRPPQLRADAKAFCPRGQTLSPTSSASSSSQASSPIPSLTNTTVSPLFSMPGKVLNVSNTDLRYRSASTMNRTPSPPSPLAFTKYDGRIWSDDEQLMRLNNLAARVMD